MKSFIEIKFQQEGIHRWKDCPYDSVSFLKEWHRHVFYFEVEMEVFELDREIEFIIVKRKLQEFVSDLLFDPVELSCEYIAKEVLTYLQSEYGNRYYSVLVLEDNENGGGVRVRNFLLWDT